MANRSLLALNKLDEFKEWLTDNNCKLLKPKGCFEVARWKSDVNGEAMPIIFNKLDSKMHFSCNEVAAAYVRGWIKQRNQADG